MGMRAMQQLWGSNVQAILVGARGRVGERKTAAKKRGWVAQTDPGLDRILETDGSRVRQWTCFSHRGSRSVGTDCMTGSSRIIFLLAPHSPTPSGMPDSSTALQGAADSS